MSALLICASLALASCGGSDGEAARAERAQAAEPVRLSPPRVVAPASPRARAFSFTTTLGPGGQTLVLWREQRGGADRVMARRGPTPRRLGPARAVAGTRSADAPRAVVTADGGAVACWPGALSDDPVRARCASAAGSGRFRRPRPIGPARSTYVTGLVEAGDGRVIAAVTRVLGRERYEVGWTTVNPSGRIATVRRLGAPRGLRGGIDLVRGPRGEVVAGYQLRTGGEDEPSPFVARTLEPGADDFGPPVDPAAATPDAAFVVDLFGGRGVGATMFTRPRDGSGPGSAAMLRRDDGTFGPAQPTRGDPAELVFDGDGAATAIALSSGESGTDCANQVTGDVLATPLGRPGEERAGEPQRVSARGQIVFDLAAGPLAGGGAIAVWVQYDERKRLRLEYASQPQGGTFSAGVPLPGRAADTPAVATGGEHTAVTWPRYARRTGSRQLVMATVTDRPPYARRAERPRRPRSPCQ